MENEKILKEMFFMWQESLNYEPDVTYERVLQYLSENLSKKHISELENLIASDTFNKQLQAFNGGFHMCQKLFLDQEEDFKLHSDIYKERIVIKIILSS